MQKTIVYYNSVNISYEVLLSKLRIDEDDEFCDRLKGMVNEALKIARPVAIYYPLQVVSADNEIKLNNIFIKESFIHKMLSNSNMVVPYVATCGIEIDQWAQGFTDFFESFAADIIKQICLSSVRDKLIEEVKDKYFSASKHLSTLNPGSLKEWPLSGQIPLFKILETVTEDIGVKLTESLLMTPNKSVSGIFFSSEDTYENCQFCTRDNCPNRRAEYSGQ